MFVDYVLQDVETKLLFGNSLWSTYFHTILFIVNMQYQIKNISFPFSQIF